VLVEARRQGDPGTLKQRGAAMGFKIKRQERVQKAFHRLGRGQVKKALKQLRKPDVLEALHEVRKTIKRTRAFLRLFRTSISKAEYRSCTEPLRDAARLLGAARDANVRLNAVVDLMNRFKRELPAREFAPFRQAFSQQCREQQRVLSGHNTFPHASRLLRAACRRISAVRLNKSGWPALATGYKKSYLAGLWAFSEVKQKPTGDRFHECRKRVKSLYYQVGLLKKARPGSLTPAEETLERLGQCLGDDHDLVLLTESWLGEQVASRSSKSIKKLHQVIGSRQRKLRSEALTLATAFYRQKPSAFCKELGTYWKQWRRTPQTTRGHSTHTVAPHRLAAIPQS
jgi:CHAD domain-containing protein